MPEGPIAFDGAVYRYSKGERLYLDNLAKHFHEVILVAFVFREGDPAYESCIHSPFSAKNITVIELPGAGPSQPGVGKKLWQFLKIFVLLLRVLPAADLLYLFLPSYPSALGWLAGRILRKKHIVYGADDWVQASESMFKWDNLRGSWFYRLYAWLNRSMEHLIVRSALFGVAAGGLLREKYNKFGCPTYDTTPRMTLGQSDVYERLDTCDSSAIMLITVGALIHDKAQYLLIEAFARLAGRNDLLRLKIVGQGPEEGKLKRLANELGVANKIEFVGYIEEEERLYELLRSADIFVLSSVTEGFPRALYEAMAIRLPIVTTDVGGIPHLMTDKVNARVVRSGDVDGLALAIDEVINDGGLRQRMIREAAKTMDTVFARMNPAQIAVLVEEYYSNFTSVTEKKT